MISNEKIMQSVFAAIDELNGQLPKGEKIEKTVDAALFGDSGKLDSLGLVSLVTTLEQRIEEDFGMTVTILEEIEVLENENPFKTIRTLVDYVTSTLEQKSNE